MPVEGIGLDKYQEPDFQRISLLPRKLDATLGTLILPRQITVMHGIERAPLSVLAHLVCIAAARKSQQAIYLDSGGNYNAGLSSRLLENWGVSKEAAKHVLVARLSDLHTIEETVNQIGQMERVAVVVLDSLTGALNLTTSPASKERQRLLYTVIDLLRGLVNDISCHLLMTDHSTVDWQRRERQPLGGNVVKHGVDSVVSVSSLSMERGVVSIMIDQTAVRPVPSGGVFRVDQKGVRSLKAK